MKIPNFISVIIACLFCCHSCVSAKEKPKGDLVSIEYTTNACMAENEFEGIVKRDSLGGFVVRAKKENYGPMYEAHIDSTQMKHFMEIIIEEKMYKYKSSYQPEMQVMDGWGWSFHAEFSDGTHIWSGGSNASPDGEGLTRTRSYMEELVKDGIMVKNE